MRVTYEGIQVQLGYYQPKDRVISPYSLFLNGASLLDPMMVSLARPSLNLSYDGDIFFFDMNWTALASNEEGRRFYNSKEEDDPTEFEILTGDPRLIRAYNYKTFGFKLGNFSLGYQDSILYTGRIFDVGYMTTPLPGVLVQYTRSSLGSPGAEVINDQSIMGVFLKYDDNVLKASSQLLLDDISLNTILGKRPENPFKLAWNIGGFYESSYGRWGIFHAGATKYTFQNVESTNKNYSYYTFFTQSLRPGDTPYFLEAQETNIGYKNGENNISFVIMYNNHFFKKKLNYAGAFEVVVTGSQSPGSNAWTEFNKYPDDGEGTRFLTGPVEKKFLFYNTIGYFIQPWWEVSLASKVGVAFNALQLTYPTENSGKWNLYPYLSPGSKTRIIFDVRLGVRFSLNWDFSQLESSQKN